MKRLVAVSAVLASAAFGAPEVLAFTTDGSAVALLSSNEMGPSELVARDLNSGEEPHREVSGSSLEDLQADLAALRPGATWQAAVCDRTSPDGQAVVNVKVITAADGAWSGGHFSAAGSSAWALSITRGGKEYPVMQVPAGDSLLACWSPDRHRVVLQVRHAGTNMRDPGSSELYLGSDGAPIVAVAGPTRAAAQKAAAQLSRTGYVVTSVTVARKKREKTVIYVAAGQEALGKKLAASFAGATVAPFDWTSPFQAMVALGGP